MTAQGEIAFLSALTAATHGVFASKSSTGQADDSELYLVVLCAISCARS